MSTYRYPDRRDEIPAKDMRVRRGSRSDESLIRDLVRSRMRNGRLRIADIGVGEGRLLPELAAFDSSVTLVDPDSQRLNVAALRARDLGLLSISTFEGTAEEFARTGPQPFDFILCSHVVQHVSREDRIPLFSALSDLLVQRGKVLITFPCTETTRDRYLLSSLSAVGSTVLTEEISEDDFDVWTDRPSDGYDKAHLPVWQSATGAIESHLASIGLTILESILYRTFEFTLRTDSVEHRLTAADHAVLAERRRA